MKHKKLYSIILPFLFLCQATAQEIELSSIFSIDTYPNFKNCIGYAIEFSPPYNSKNKVTFSFSQSFNYFEYSCDFSSDSEAKTQLRDVDPKNEIYSFSIYYKFNLLKKQKNNLLLGPKFGINFFKVNESIVYTYKNEPEIYSMNQKYWRKNKIGLGFVLEYQRKIFEDKISLAVTSEPEIIFYSKFLALGSNEPYFILSNTFKLSLLFNLTKTK